MALKWLSSAMLAGAFALLPAAAAADAIDGHWCSQSRPLSLSIQGPDLVSPGGTRMQGNYDRHYFSYVAPDGDPDAGQEVFMTLIDDDTVHSVRGQDRARVETWKRSGPTT